MRSITPWSNGNHQFKPMNTNPDVSRLAFLIEVVIDSALASGIS